MVIATTNASIPNVFDIVLENLRMKKTTVQLLDDLDGTVIENGSGATVSFTFEGDSYEIDLSAGNLAEFRSAVKPYINVSRRVGYVPAKPRGASSAGSDRAELQAIRAWAAANGTHVSDRGRISGTVREAYAKAQA
ncbi:Lsr2 family protein [Cryobacterium sp. Hb1]